MNIKVLLGFVFTFVTPTASLRTKEVRVVEDTNEASIVTRQEDILNINATYEICVNKEDNMRFSQVSAMMDLYTEFGKDIDRDFDDRDWNEIAYDECQWPRVVCQGGLVTRLEMHKFEIFSETEELSVLNELVNLEYIDFSDNDSLYGNITDLTELKKVVFLDISGSYISGKASGNNFCAPNGSARVIIYSDTNVEEGFECNCDTDTVKVCLKI